MKIFNKFILNKQQLINNVLSIKKQLKPGVLFCACVKANAYGCGAAHVAKTIENHVDYFATNSLAEALEIRNFCPTSKILILGKTPIDNYDICANNNIDISISSARDLKNINTNIKLNIFLALNTGMNRFGTSDIKEIKTILKIIEKNKNLKLVGAFSHFSTGLENKYNCNKQFAKFCELKKLLPQDIIFSIASSGTASFINYQENMVRIGFNIYAGEVGVLNIASEIVHILKVKKGDPIGYSCAYTAPKDMIIGVVPLGYADGISRGLSNCGKVIINEKLAPIVGQICMDCFMVGLDNIKAKVGSGVVVFGQTKKQSISVLDWAKLTNESPYTLLTNLNYSRCDYIEK